MIMLPNIKSSIKNGDFPLNHDSVLVVRQVNGIQYFTGQLSELVRFIPSLSHLISVKSIEIVSVEDFD